MHIVHRCIPEFIYCSMKWLFFFFFWCSDNPSNFVQLCLKEAIRLNGRHRIFKSLQITQNEDRWVKRTAGEEGQCGYSFFYVWVNCAFNVNSSVGELFSHTSADIIA